MKGVLDCEKRGLSPVFPLDCEKRGLPPALSAWLKKASDIFRPAALAAVLLLPAMAAHAGPYGATQCAPSRFGGDLGCSAGDVSINTITIAGTPPPFCIGGQSLLLDLNVTIQFGSTSRYDVGVFVSADGKSPKLLAPTGAASCTVAVLPTASPFLNLDTDSCGDGNGTIGGGTGAGSFTMTNVAVPCITDGSGNAVLTVPYLVSWDNSSGNSCSDNTYPVPGTSSKCNTGTVVFPPGYAINVLPAISITDGVTTVRSGGALTYTVVISNATASPVAAGAVFTAPAVADLSISSVNCVAAGGATCPASTTVALMQGSGIILPVMPNNSSLTFTVVGTYTGTPTSPTTLTNTATVTANSYPSSASDTDTVMVPPTVAKTFSPSAIASGGTSTLTVTLTNPNAVAITGAAFTDTYPANMKNTTVAATTCAGGTATAVVNGTTLSLSGATIPASGSCTVTVSVTTTTTGTNTTSTVTSGNAATGSAASATLSIIGAVSSFNAFETSTVANAISGSIYTKLAGTTFALDVVAISGGAQAAGFTNAVKVELLGNTVTGIALDAQNCPTSSTLLQTVSPNPTITAGRSTVSFTAAANAWRDVRVRVSYPAAAPTVISCSTDNFSIRPATFTITSTDATNNNSSGAPTIKAGANFNLTATAVAGYNGTPSLDATKVVGSSTAGALAGSFGVAPVATGVATGSSFTYSEVGNFGLNANAVYDTSFTGVDPAGECTADFSNTLAGGKYGCKIGSTAVAQTTGSSGFGRFIPDHFDTAVIATATTPMPCPTGPPILTCPALYPGFIYSGQPFSVQVFARNLAGATTTNYDNSLGYSKAVTLTAWDALGSTATQNPPGTAVLANDTVAATVFSAGEAITAIPTYTFATSPTAPTDIYMRAIDTDTASSLRAIPASSVEGGVKVVSGRVKIGNAHGSELLSLPMTATVQYYNGTNWLTSTTDSVTSFNSNLSTAGGNLVAAIVDGLGGGVTVSSPGTSAVVAGVRTFRLAAPGVRGSANISLNAPGYLPSTTGRATFGVYKGANEFIYLRENY